MFTKQFEAFRIQHVALKALADDAQGDDLREYHGLLTLGARVVNAAEEALKFDDDPILFRAVMAARWEADKILSRMLGRDHPMTVIEWQSAIEALAEAVRADLYGSGQFDASPEELDTAVQFANAQGRWADLMPYLRGERKEMWPPN